MYIEDNSDKREIRTEEELETAELSPPFSEAGHSGFAGLSAVQISVQTFLGGAVYGKIL